MWRTATTTISVVTKWLYGHARNIASGGKDSSLILTIIVSTCSQTVTATPYGQAGTRNDGLWRAATTTVAW